MRSFYFEYRLAPGDYRAASYFNNFGLKRFQGAFVVRSEEHTSELQSQR